MSAVRINDRRASSGLVAVDGAPLRPTPRAAFFKGERSPFLQQWRPAVREDRDDIRAAWQASAGRSVDAMQNSGFIAGTIETSTASVVGTHLHLAARPDHTRLGWTEDQAIDWAEEVEATWEAWANDPDECDAGGRMTFGQMQQLGYVSWLSFGENLALLPIFSRRGGSPTKVMMMPPTRLSQKSDGMRVVQGVEIDGYGAPVAYHFSRRYDDKRFEGIGGDIVLPRFDRGGRRQVLHIFGEAMTSTRGISPLAPVLKVVRQIDQFCDATLTAALLQTIFAATLKTELQGEAAFEGLMSAYEQEDKAHENGMDALQARRADWYDTAKVDLFTHGKIAQLFPSDQLEFHSANHPNSQFDVFMGWLCREVARCAGVTYESATGDYRTATYSSVRMATAEIWNIVLKRRSTIAVPFSQRIYEVWLADQIASGRVSFPGGYAAFLERRAAACRASWSGPPKPQADDLKTARANQTLIQMGVTSLRSVCVEYGTDWQDEMDQRARERAYAQKRGLPDPHPFPEDPAYKRSEQGTSEDKTDDPGYMPDARRTSVPVVALKPDAYELAWEADWEREEAR
jgi:lambda family phage portal protein